MADDVNELFYVRGADDTVFGPVGMDVLVEWAADSRIDPTSVVSRDQKTWVAAPLVPELGMTWLVETEPGTFYGPFNRRVVDGLLEAGTITKEARLYELDGGRSSAERTRLEAEIAAKTKTISELESRASAQAETTKQTLSFMEGKLSELTAALGEVGKAAEADHSAAKEEVFRSRERADAAEERAAKAEAERDALVSKIAVLETELSDTKGQLESVTRFSSVATPAASSSVVQPEIVVSDAPPPRNASRFPGMGSSSGLAALEAAARRELAEAKKHGISIGGIFGGKK